MICLIFSLLLFKIFNLIKIFKFEGSKPDLNLIESEIDHERAVLKKIEHQALNTKYETKIQYLEVEIDTLRSKIRKLLKVIKNFDSLLLIIRL